MLVFVFVLAAIFIVMALLAVIKKPGSVYKDKPDEQNIMQGKKVVFVENPDEKENADGVRGHLDAIGKTEHQAGIYEKVFRGYWTLF